MSTTMSFDGTTKDLFHEMRHIPLSYDNAESQTSSLRLVLTLFPDWEHSQGKIEFIRFKDGITNTVRLGGFSWRMPVYTNFLLIIMP